MTSSILNLTAHASSRMAQRGVSGVDLELIVLIGTEVEGGFLVMEKQVQALERDLKRLRDQARRLVGKRVVINGGHVVTAYHAQPGKESRLLRRANQRSIASSSY